MLSGSLQSDFKAFEGKKSTIMKSNVAKGVEDQSDGKDTDYRPIQPSDFYLAVITEHEQTGRTFEMIPLSKSLKSNPLPLFPGHTWILDPPTSNYAIKPVLIRSRTRATKVLKLLLGRDLDGSEPMSVRSRNLPLTVWVNIEDSGIASRSSNSPNPNILNQATVFRTVIFTYRSASVSLSSTHHLAFRITGKERGLNRQTPVSSDDSFASAEIISGICLIQPWIIEKITELPLATFRRYSPREWQQMFNEESLYERSTRKVLSRGIADLIAMLAVRAHPNASLLTFPINVSMDIPRFQYYAAGVKMLEAGQWEWQDVQAWVDLVEATHQRVASSFATAIRGELSKRGLDPQDVVRLSTSHSAHAVERCFKQGMEKGILPSLSDHLKALAQDKTAHWDIFIQCLPDTEVPRSTDDLGKLLYVYELLRPLLELGSLGSPTSMAGKLVINVDDSFHFRIYERASKVLARMRSLGLAADCTLVAVFPFTPVCYVTHHGRQNLWHFNDNSARSLVRSPQAGQDSTLSKLRSPLGVDIERLCSQ